MLEITGDQVALLNDVDLRELVVRLVEAELLAHGLPISALTAGGHQNAPDGGIDVRVELATAASLDFIRRPITGFQVKATDMTPAEISSEMRPGGQLLKSIADTLQAGGSYVIVSSKGTVADAPLRKRRQAMRDAASGIASGDMDFYDRTRLAAWVKAYKGVEFWLRQRIGQPLTGWVSCASWALPDEARPYLHDGLGRVNWRSGSSESLSVQQGLDAIRGLLAKPGKMVRLVGLSGVGKTRFVQALFEKNLGERPLDASIAVYADSGAGPTPSPADYLRVAGLNGRPIIMIVDNCSPGLHRELSRLIANDSPKASVLTVEHDVGDDEPEETEVFELAPSSALVLDAVLSHLAPHIAANDRHTITALADGNARVALALAKTLRAGETLGALRDRDLFERLFHQNQHPDPQLQRAAQVCSLVYSFDSTTTPGDDAEMQVLADLAGTSTTELHARLALLEARDLLQRRSRWRALLPQALSIRLGKEALAAIPNHLITARIATNERLLRSFARQLSFMHDSAEARQIAEAWFEDPEWLLAPAKLSPLGHALYVELAPLAPELALRNLEFVIDSPADAATLEADPIQRSRWTLLLRKLAYDPGLFDRAAKALLLIDCVMRKPALNSKAWVSLFHPWHSGTQALVGQRIGMLRDLLRDGAPPLRTFVAQALDATLTPTPSSSPFDVSFGAHPRSYGWQPASLDEELDWYRQAFGLLEESLRSGWLAPELVKGMLAANFRLLWLESPAREDLSALALRLKAAPGGWPQGWIAARSMLQLDGKHIEQEGREALQRLAAELSPSDLAERTRAYVLSVKFGALDVADGEETDEEFGDEANQRVDDAVRVIASDLVREPQALAALLPELLVDGSGRQETFGHALAQLATDRSEIWDSMLRAFAALDGETRSPVLMLGFLGGVSKADPGLATAMLDGLLSAQGALAQWMPLFLAAHIDDRTGERLIAVQEGAQAEAWTYGLLGLGPTRLRMTAADYLRVVLALPGVVKGQAVALSAIGGQFLETQRQKRAIEPELLDIGRALLALVTFEDIDSRVEFHLLALVSECFAGASGEPFARAFCETFATAVADYRSSAHCQRRLAKKLFELQPMAALDAFMRQPRSPIGRSAVQMFGSDLAKNPVRVVPAETVMAWVGADPEARAVAIGPEVAIAARDADGNWNWSPLARSLLSAVSDKSALLAAFEQQLQPMSWSGTLAAALHPIPDLLDRLQHDPDELVSAWARRALEALVPRIAGDSRWRVPDEARFE